MAFGDLYQLSLPSESLRISLAVYLEVERSSSSAAMRSSSSVDEPPALSGSLP